jgi:hypothetical protein
MYIFPPTLKKKKAELQDVATPCCIPNEICPPGGECEYPIIINRGSLPTLGCIKVASPQICVQ